MNAFNHFLLTRFNVPLNPGEIGSGKTLGTSIEWLNRRFEIFDKFCHPSVHQQSNQNFKWLVFFDSRTPAIFKEKIQEYAKWKNFIPAYIDNFSLSIVTKVIAEHITEETKYLITTTIDNDDAISQDYIQIIQDNFHEQEFELLNITYGYVWHEPSGKIYLRGTGGNPFISLIEKIEKFKTVWVEPHHKYHGLYHQTGQLKQIKTKPAWLQVVHGGNLYNGVNGIRQPRKKLGNDFLINVQDILKEENLLEIWLEQRINSITSTPIVKAVRTKIGARTKLQNTMQQLKHLLR